jgi:3-oxoacyl-[acyl-carrier protein] reductase
MAAAFELSLSGRTALVTGASTGIGRAIALAFAQAGAAVVVNHLGRAAEAAALVHEIQGLGARAWAIEADVSLSVDVTRLAAQAEQACGTVDVLVNNAGIIQEKPFLETSEDDWDRMLATDLKSVFLTSRAFLPGMVAGGRGVIINIASDLGPGARTLRTLLRSQGGRGRPDAIAGARVRACDPCQRHCAGAGQHGHGVS